MTGLDELAYAILGAGVCAIAASLILGRVERVRHARRVAYVPALAAQLAVLVADEVAEGVAQRLDEMDIARTAGVRRRPISRGELWVDDEVAARRRKPGSGRDLGRPS